MRLDKYLVENNYTESRSKALYLIKTGFIKINQQIVIKPAHEVKSQDMVEVQKVFEYVGRGGYKIAGFLDPLNFQIEQKAVLDLGCSVGGFTDYFLQHNAESVFAIDIAKKILDPTLRQNNRVQFFDGVDIQDIDQLRQVLINKLFDIISVDITNVSVYNFLTQIAEFLSPDGVIVVLLKPQYEGPKSEYKDENVVQLTNKFETWISQYFTIMHKDACVIRGGSKNKGNQEYFYLMQKKI